MRCNGKRLRRDVGKHGNEVGVNFGGNNHNAHYVNKAHNNHLRNLVGKRFAAGGQPQVQNFIQRAFGEGAQVFKRKADINKFAEKV